MTPTPPASPAPSPRDLPYAFGPPPTTCVLRAHASDFRVDEVLGVEPDGEGEHLLLHIEKEGANTPWVSRQLARWADVAPGDVSYSGMKDRHAVTRQWFSVRLGGRGDPALDTLVIEGVRVLATARHGRKLRRGTHAANHFELTLRDLSDDLCSRAQQVFAAGVPNYFGAQRYGRRNL
ncbi:MAG: tRNA pseudouridine(13) synthase TruD, partial [Pseudomonadota bacterium]